LILSRTQELRCQIDFKTFDRFFPNQDRLPSGGFANLIALPLQKKSRESGNTVFLDDRFDIIDDQWRYLSQVRRLNNAEVEALIYLAGHPRFPKSGHDDDAILRSDETLVIYNEQGLKENLLKGKTIEVFLAAMIRIPLGELPPKVITALKRTASFANPEFYKLQRMRRATYPEPRFIFSGKIREHDILLPRGCLDSVGQLLSSIGATVVLRDERLGRKDFLAEFRGELKPEQQIAVDSLLRYDTGILQAPPGAGKTVMGCALIAKRKVTTLILVHRQPLLEQWRQRLQDFLGLDKSEIGTIGRSSKKPTGKVDLAMLQTLSRMENIQEIAKSYAQIIIDEAHHVPATSFEGVMKMLPSRFVLGLTATPYRKDGLLSIARRKVSSKKCYEI
jgi:Type III restriction enzyme, res subunit